MDNIFKHNSTKVVDMTQGNPIKTIIFFAIPLFLGNVFQQAYNIIDTIIAGYELGERAVAAIGATSALYSLLINLAIGFNSGFEIIIGRFFGAKDIVHLRKSIAAVIKLNVVISIVITSIGFLTLRPMLRFLNTPKGIFEQAYTYIAIILGGLVFTIFYDMCAGILRAFGNSRIPLMFLILSSILNLFMDVVFVIILQFDIEGVAIATVIAESISAILCISYILKNYKEYLPSCKDFAFEKVLYIEMLETGASMGLTCSVFSIGSTVLQSGINHLGEGVITANTVSRRIVEVVLQQLGVISYSNATFVSQNWGARQFDRIRKTIKKVIEIEILWSIISMIIILLFGESMLQVLIHTDNLEIIQNGYMNLQINSIFFATQGVLLVLRNAMQSMGSKIVPIISSFIELFIKVIATETIVIKWGYFGASMTEPFTWLICMFYLIFVYILNSKKLYKNQIY